MAAEPSGPVVQIMAQQCSTSTDPLVLSGFAMQRRGHTVIATALHGVVGCKDVSVASPASKDAVAVRIVAVDIKHDAALLSSSELQKHQFRHVKFGTMPKNAWKVRFYVKGYPFGLNKPMVTNLRVRRNALVELDSLIPNGGETNVLRERNSPSLSESVISVEGHLTPGMSGAPIFADDKLTRVIGIADGGLDEGVDEITWAIPVSELKWQSFESQKAKLNALGTKLSTRLFRYSKQWKGGDSVKCFGRVFRSVKSISLKRLVSGVNDQAAYRAYVNAYNLNGAPLNFVVYRDAKASASLVVPKGWKMHGGKHCVATTTIGQQVLRLRFREKSFSPQLTMKQRDNIFSDWEFKTFCSQGFVVEPQWSTPSARVAARQGVLSRQKAYIVKERRCAYPPPMSVKQMKQIWPRLTAPNISPRGRAQCVSLCAGALLPDFIEGRYMIRFPEYVKGWGFVSLTMTEDRLLFAFAKLEANALADDLYKCSATMARTDKCATTFRINEAWGAAVLAATASGARGGS